MKFSLKFLVVLPLLLPLTILAQEEIEFGSLEGLEHKKKTKCDRCVSRYSPNVLILF